jgi:hypothetical protein
LTVLLIVLATLAAYVGIGWWLAKRDMHRAWERARKQWSTEQNARGSVMEQTFAMAALWWFVIPTRAATRALGGAVDRADPKMREREMKARELDLREREAKIARLERELGIGRSR